MFRYQIESLKDGEKRAFFVGNKLTIESDETEEITTELPIKEIAILRGKDFESSVEIAVYTKENEIFTIPKFATYLFIKTEENK